MAARRRRTLFVVCGLLTLAGGSAGARGDSPGPAGARDAGSAVAVQPLTRPTTLPATGPSTAPAAGWSPTTAATSDDPRLARAIMQLGSGSFRAREAAAVTLWSMGDRAIPALKWAASSGNPELAMRARALLESFAYGVRPDTPRVVIDLLQQYRAGVPQQRPTVARSLAENGVSGARVLLKLSQDERDPVARQAVLESLAATARLSAAKLLGEGDADTARQILGAVAGQHESNARDLAAFLLIRGGLDEEIGRIRATLPAPKADNPGAGGAGAPGARPRGAGLARPPVFARQSPPTPWERLSYLLRAKGDVAAAYRAAGQTSDGPLTDALLAESGDWKTLALRIDARGVDPASVENLGFATAYHRLAGDVAGTEKWVAKLLQYADENPNDHAHVAEALLLNDRPEQAIEILRKRREPALAVEFLEPRLEFDAVLAAVAQAKADGSPALPLVRAKSAVALHFMGRSREAGAALESILAGDDGVVDFSALLAVIEAGRETGQPLDRLDAWCVATIKSGRPNQPQEQPVHVFERAGFDRPEQAGDWWNVMRDLYVGEAAGDTFARLKALDRKELPADEVKRLTDRAQASVTNLAGPARDARLMLVADTLEDLGRTPEATAVVEHLAEISPTAPTLERLGDLYAKAEQWPRAVAAYDRAWERDRSRPLPLLLRGWMLVKSGGEKQGRELIETAHALPLSDETDRHALMTALARRGLADEARRERDLILRTAEPGSWERGDALRRAAEEAHSKGDDLAAADLWDRAFLNNLNTHVSFVEAQANLMIPVLIHRARAQGYARAGRTADAVAEAKTCLDHCPGDADAQIAIVNTLAKSNHPAEADAVYARARTLYAKLAASYPESAPAHNLIAWFESRCRRDLDDAVTHGQKAATLEPDNTAVLDTLAEAHLQRGDLAKSRELVKRCLKLEPTSEHHRKNLARIESATPGKPVPDLDGPE